MSSTARNAMIVAHMGYARTCIRRYSPSKLLEQDDANSEGYAALIIAIDGYDPVHASGASLKTHIRSVINSRLLSYIKNQKIRKRRGPNNQTMIDLPVRISLDSPGSPDFSEDRLWRDRIDAVHNWIDFNSAYKLLYKKQRALLYAFYVDGVGLKELAARDGITHAGVSWRIKQARDEIIKYMSG